MNRKTLPVLDAGFGRKIGHCLKRFNILGATVGIAAIVECIDSDKNIVATLHFSPRQREGKKNRISSGNIRYRYFVRHFIYASILRHFQSTRKRRSAKFPEVDFSNNMLHDSVRRCNSSCRFDLKSMALAVVERKCKNAESLLLCDRQSCR